MKGIEIRENREINSELFKKCFSDIDFIEKEAMKLIDPNS